MAQLLETSIRNTLLVYKETNIEENRKFLVDNNGNTEISGTLTTTGVSNLNGGININECNFSVEGNGNTTINGTLTANNSVNIGTSSSEDSLIINAKTELYNSNFDIIYKENETSTSKFSVDAADGNTNIKGSLFVVNEKFKVEEKDIPDKSDKKIADAAIKGDLSITGGFSVIIDKDTMVSIGENIYNIDFYVDELKDYRPGHLSYDGDGTKWILKYSNKIKETKGSTLTGTIISIDDFTKYKELTIKYRTFIYKYTGSGNNGNWAADFTAGGSSLTAENVIFTKDLVFNKQFGKYHNNFTPSSSETSTNYSKIFVSEANRKKYRLKVSDMNDTKPWNLYDLLNDAFSDYKTSTGTKIDPSATFKIYYNYDTGSISNRIIEGEIDTKIEDYNASFTVNGTGSFSYGFAKKTSEGFEMDSEDSSKTKKYNDSGVVFNAAISTISVPNDDELSTVTSSFPLTETVSSIDTNVFAVNNSTTTFYLKYNHTSSINKTATDEFDNTYTYGMYARNDDETGSDEYIVAKDNQTSSLTFTFSGWAKYYAGGFSSLPSSDNLIKSTSGERADSGTKITLDFGTAANKNYKKFFVAVPSTIATSASYSPTCKQYNPLSSAKVGNFDAGYNISIALNKETTTISGIYTGVTYYIYTYEATTLTDTKFQIIL